MIKPPRLKAGQTIGLLAPASGVRDPQKIDRAVAFFESQGFRVVCAPNARRCDTFLSAPDVDRLRDFHDLWASDDIHALVCLRGGYGTCRLINGIDYQLIRKKPKIFLGYSDITNLHLAIMREAGLVTFHGPMAASNFADPASPPWTWDMTHRMLTSTEPLGWLSTGAPLDRQPVTLIEGHGRQVSGPLVGGNLAHVQVTIGTRFEIETRGKVVFLEDLGERPYKIDRMLTHLLSAGKLSDAAGIALGIFDNCGEPGVDPEGALHPPSLIEVFRERLGGLGIPVLYGLPISHTPVNATLPMGLQATLDPERSDLYIDEAAVTA